MGWIGNQVTLCNMEIGDFIKNLREADRYMEIIFTNGGCYKFAKLLQSMYSGGEIVLEHHDHALYFYKGELWDITGKVEKADTHTPTEDEIKMAEEWDFFENNLLSLGDCDNCGEPIVI